MQGDEVQKQVAEVAKALFQRADEFAILLACAITRRSWSSPLMFGCPRRGTAHIVCSRAVDSKSGRRRGRMPTMTALQWQSSKR